jgi:predicted outer membrane repeat protein
MANRTNLTTLRVISVFLVVLAASAIAAGEVIYVDANASGANNGSNWANAYNDLQDGLGAALNGDEIRVAQGIYKPDQGIGVTPGDRGATFQLKNGVAIKGGYAGFGEPDPNARNIEAYETILSGDLVGNDGPDFANNGENSFHVVTASRTDATAVLDGFTITSGNAFYGGGMYNDRSSPMVTNCTFSGNRAGIGGGMCNDSSSPTVTNCTFSGNSASMGGGMINSNGSSPTVTNCTFSGNSATVSGGGMDNNSSMPTVTNCTFISNSADYGGGMDNHGGRPTVTNCTFSGNSARDGGGMFSDSGSPAVTNCTFSGNLASVSGGGMHNFRSSPTLINCFFSGNRAGESGGGIYNWFNNMISLFNCTFSANSATNGNTLVCDSLWQEYPSDLVVTNCILWDGDDEILNNDNSVITITYSDVQGGWPGTGNINSNPLFVDSAIGDYHLLANSPCIDVGDNTAIPPSGVVDLNGNYRIANGTVDMGAYEFGSTAPPSTLFVDARATGANNGSSWVDAFAGLQEALIVATVSPQVDEIRVAEGIYKPTGFAPSPPPPPPPPPQSPLSPPPPLPPSPAGDRMATFQLINGVTIKGGYAGFGEPDPNARDIDAYKTVLSGDIGSVVYQGDNCYHVVTGSFADETAVLDGFSITAGHADGHNIESSGGGMVNWDGSPTVRNCIFSGNSAEWNGGGMANERNSRPTLVNCTFSGNSAREGGAMCNRESSPTVTNCIFSGNSSGLWGGGMFNDQSSPMVTTCVFSGNSGSNGGGMINSNSSSPTVTNCTFSGNSAEWNGGGIYNSVHSRATLTNCTFRENWAKNGGGMWNSQSSPTLTNCVFSRNSAREWGGGMCNLSGSNPTLTNCTFSGNSAIVRGGGMYNKSSMPTLNNCKFIENSASYGGGMENYYHGNPMLTNCTFSGNSAGLWGGGVDNVESSPRMANCMFIGNSAENEGGGMCNSWYSRPMLANCTFAGNSASNGNALACGPHSYNHPSNLWLINCILWNGGNGIWNNDNSTITITYSDVQGDWPGIGNIDADPCFVDAANGDYHLLPGSPCINAGAPGYVGGPNETDLDGKPRAIGGRIDMGVYEFNHIPIADAGPDQVVEAQGAFGARVTLDGSCSSDADSTPGTNDDIVSFDWYKVDACDPNFEDFLGSGEVIDCNLPLGEHIIVLEVIDRAGAFDTNEVTIVVQDTTPPDFTLSVTPTTLWPVNHKMVLITLSWRVSDICDASPEVSLVSITMNEEDEATGDGHTTNDIQVGDNGLIYLRAERSGAGSGRIYTITYQAVDCSGNAAVASATVTVPHDQR